MYSKLFWGSPGAARNGDGVVVHELAHQWFGDDVAVERWKDIWLNEGFATYTEWLWSEHEGEGTPQEIFQATYDAIPADDLAREGRRSGRFDVWLFTAERPPPSPVSAGQAQAMRSATEQARAGSENWRDVVQQRLRIGRY